MLKNESRAHWLLQVGRDDADLATTCGDLTAREKGYKSTKNVDISAGSASVLRSIHGAMAPKSA